MTGSSLAIKEENCLQVEPLRFLHAEAGKVPSGNGIWTLRHIELSGNSVSSQVQQDISDAIALLQFLHSQEGEPIKGNFQDVKNGPR